MSQSRRIICSDCDSPMDRRDFVKLTAGAALVAGAQTAVGPGLAPAAPKSSSAAETTVKRFYDTLSDEQKKKICLPFEHKLRHKISPNWEITEPAIGDKFYTKEQRALIKEIIRGVTSEEGYEKLLRQMEDDSGGLDEYYVAVFGKPGQGKFQWELTGRHLTLRADGDNVKNQAFGGPIVYGHGAEEPKENLFHYQTKKANEVFKALDEKHRRLALLTKAPRENQVPIQGEKGKFPGVAVGDLSDDQKDLVESVVKIMLAVYRKEDVDEVVAILKKTGGLNKLHMAFYKEGDINDDKVWDIWRIEGPGFVWHFRGSPHVHTYLNIGIKG